MSLAIEAGESVNPKASALRVIAAQANEFLAELTEPDRAAIEAIGVRVRLAPNEPLIVAGEEIGHVSFVLAGLLSEQILHKDGKGSLLRLIGSEGVAGIGGLYAAGAALGPTLALVHTDVLRVETSALRSLIATRPRLRAAVDAYFAQAAGDIARQAGCAACHRLDQRLPSLLLLWERRACATHRLEATHEQLCEMLGAQRTTVTTLMRALKAGGALRTGRGWLRVMDHDALARRSCGCEGAF